MFMQKEAEVKYMTPENILLALLQLGAKANCTESEYAIISSRINIDRIQEFQQKFPDLWNQAKEKYNEIQSRYGDSSDSSDSNNLSTNNLSDYLTDEQKQIFAPFLPHYDQGTAMGTVGISNAEQINSGTNVNSGVNVSSEVDIEPPNIEPPDDGIVDGIIDGIIELFKFFFS